MELQCNLRIEIADLKTRLSRKWYHEDSCV